MFEVARPLVDSDGLAGSLGGVSLDVAHFAITRLPLFSDGGAVERRVLALSEAQARSGHSVTIYASGLEDRSMDWNGVAIKLYAESRARMGARIGHKRNLLKAHQDLRAAVHDVVHFHGSPEAIPLLRRSETVRIISVDYFKYFGSDTTFGKMAYRAALRSADVICPVSDFCSSELTRFYGYDLGSAIRVVPNGVDLRRFRFDRELRNQYRLQHGLGDKKVIAYIGRVNEQKGVDLLLEAVRFWRLNEITDVKVVIAGPIGQFGSAEDGGWEARMRAVGASYFGIIAEQDINAFYNAVDLIVVPTRRDEMFGMVAIEALASGTTVVASDLGGLREVVPLELGVRVMPDNARVLESAMRGVLSDMPVPDATVKARVAFAARYSWANIAELYNVIYEEASAAKKLR